MTIFIVDVEGISTRYTQQWKEHLPKQVQQDTMKNVVVILGGETPQATTPGAFLNFAGTNIYKSNQLVDISEMFCNGEVKDGDYFLYTDAWNPTVIQLKYMAELLGIKITIGGLWHAGSYDSQDFLGRIIGDANWVRYAEKSMFECYDQNFFATQFHIDMFLRTLLDIDGVHSWEGEDLIRSGKIVQTGWPMEYLQTNLSEYKGRAKENLILFPHRIAPEKQVDIFRDLAAELPQYKFVVCQEQELSKEEYHDLLARAKVVFSANLQETLGISWFEGAIVGAIPMVPDRLSYSEMADNYFTYPSEWTENFAKYTENKESVKRQLVDYVENYSKHLELLDGQVDYLASVYFTGKKLYDNLK